MVLGLNGRGIGYHGDLVDKGLCEEAAGTNQITCQRYQYTNFVPEKIIWRVPVGSSGGGTKNMAPNRRRGM